MSDNEYICPICGEPTNKYYGNYRKDRLCYKHGMMANAGEIVQCPDCGEWHNVDEDCECKNKVSYQELPVTGFEECIICGEKSYGYAYCTECWKKNSKDNLLLNLNNYINKKTKKNLCEICGEEFSKDKNNPYCSNCMKKIHNGEIKICFNCGKWHNAKEDCKCTQECLLSESEEYFIRLNEGHEFCVTCGNPTPYGKLQCRDCYYETCDYMNSLNKNSLMNEFRDYYFNLKDAIFRMKDFDTVKSNCNKLIAIAYQNAESNDDSSLINRIEKDVITLIEAKRPKVEPAIETPTSVIEKDEQRENIYSAIDGHRVKSQMECIIDNALWNAGILHAYEQPVIELDFIRKKCDWLIPITGPTKGIYIEYWGMNTEKYLKDRKEKEELYKQNNIPYVGIEKDDPKDSTFIYTLIQDLKRKAKEYFGFMPEWKK